MEGTGRGLGSIQCTEHDTFDHHKHPDLKSRLYQPSSLVLGLHHGGLVVPAMWRAHVSKAAQ